MIPGTPRQGVQPSLQRKQRVLVTRQPLCHLHLGSLVPHHSYSPLFSLSADWPSQLHFCVAGGMATIAPVHKLSQFKNLKKLSLELLNLCGPPPHSHLCVERARPFVWVTTSSKEAAGRACGDAVDSRRKCCDSEGISRKVSQKAVTSVLS